MGVLKKSKGAYAALLSIGGQDVRVTMKAMPLGERFDLLSNIQDLNLRDARSFDQLCDFLSEVVVRFDDEQGTVKEVLRGLDDPDNFRDIVQQVCRQLTLSEAERKNSHSSSGQPTAASAGHAEKPAGTAEEPASTTPKKTEAS